MQHSLFIFVSVLAGSLLTGCGGGAGQVGGTAPSTVNATAITKHVVLTNVATQAMGTVAALDPTGVSAIAASHASEAIYERSHEQMVDESLGSLSPEQRALMKKHMKGEISEEEFRTQLFESYELDANGNPVSER